MKVADIRTVLASEGHSVITRSSVRNSRSKGYAVTKSGRGFKISVRDFNKLGSNGYPIYRYIATVDGDRETAENAAKRAVELFNRSAKR